MYIDSNAYYGVDEDVEDGEDRTSVRVMVQDFSKDGEKIFGIDLYDHDYENAWIDVYANLVIERDKSEKGYKRYCDSIDLTLVTNNSEIEDEEVTLITDDDGEQGRIFECLAQTDDGRLDRITEGWYKGWPDGISY